MMMMMMMMMIIIMYAVASKTRVKRNQVRLLIAKTRVTKSILKSVVNSILKSVPIARQKYATSVPKLGQASKLFIILTPDLMYVCYMYVYYILHILDN